MEEPQPLLEVKDLAVQFTGHEGTITAVDGVHFTLFKGKTLGVVGESGCGKSVTAQAILRIIPRNGRIVRGAILLHRDSGAIDLVRLDPRGADLRAVRGGEIGIVFQEPMTALSPVHTIGQQIMEGILLHRRASKREARRLAIELLQKVGIPRPYVMVDEYPHRLSGGMRQRAMIASALSCHPRLLIADEPTTALDVTIQAQILELLRDLQDEFQMSMIMITHNLGVVADVSHEVAVMYLGEVVEHGAVEQIFGSPKHPYTQGLLRSIPRLGKKSGKPLRAIEGMLPDPYSKPRGCRFHTRCQQAIAGLCDVRKPKLLPHTDGRQVACFLYESAQEGTEPATGGDQIA